MKRTFLLSLFVVSCCLAQAQTGTTTGYKAKETDANQKVLERGKDYDVNFDIDNHEAFFIEGEDSLYRYLYSRIVIPEEAANKNLIANAMIGIQVNFDGKVQEPYSIAKVGYGIDEELLKAISEIEFVPAKQGSIPYRSEIVFEIPIKSSYLYNIQTGVGMEK